MEKLPHMKHRPSISMSFFGCRCLFFYNIEGPMSFAQAGPNIQKLLKYFWVYRGGISLDIGMLYVRYHQRIRSA
jgi:hypothetical protein